MSTWAILATGPSMSQAVADSVRGRCGVIAVSDAHVLAPWADALVSNDIKWWEAHPSVALLFAGRKFCGQRRQGLEYLPSLAIRENHAETNSGLQAVRAARDFFAATKVLLLGFDMHGTHFFGSHRPPLSDTIPSRREIHKRQFSEFELNGLRVVNCTEGSELKCFPFGVLEEELQ